MQICGVKINEKGAKTIKMPYAPYDLHSYLVSERFLFSYIVNLLKKSLRSNKFQNIFIDSCGFRSWHTMRKSRIGNQFTVF